MGAERRNEGGGRSSGAWLRRERREERAASPVPAAAAEHSRETKRTKRYVVVSRLIQTLWGRKQGIPSYGIRELLTELEPNSRRNFHTIPNAGIRTQILEFLIPDPIPYIQTRC
jgi:hypothetical protein